MKSHFPAKLISPAAAYNKLVEIQHPLVTLYLYLPTDLIGPSFLLIMTDVSLTRGLWVLPSIS